jgi:hypothetical protein
VYSVQVDNEKACFLCFSMLYNNKTKERKCVCSSVSRFVRFFSFLLPLPTLNTMLMPIAVNMHLLSFLSLSSCYLLHFFFRRTILCIIERRLFVHVNIYVEIDFQLQLLKG